MTVEHEARVFEEKTGVSFPLCLAELYQKNGNGGFGLEYGFIGIISGHKTDLGDSILTLYSTFTSASIDDPNWYWPKQLIPFIHIGCGLHLCIDVSDKQYKVVEFDPTDYDPDEGPKKHFSIISNSFNSWVESSPNKLFKWDK